MKTRFVGRKVELAKLQTNLDKAGASITVVYGRRRIGKSALIRKALEDRPALYFEGLENQPKHEQIRNFLFQLSRQIPGRSRKGHAANHDGVATWREAFSLLCKILDEVPATVVLDEFQWMANYRSEIVSDLKMVWEQYLSRIPGVKLILCGSIASFMNTRVIKSSAMYGRTDLVIHLKGFLLDETRKMLPGKGTDEVLEARMMVGGVPKYLELLQDGSSIRLAMEDLAFTANGYLVDEYDRIFTSHFGRNLDYDKIVRALAQNPYGLFRKELAKKASLDQGGGLTEHLYNLEQAGFISSVTPLDKGSSSRLIRYHLSDAYLRFYFTFIEPRQRKIRSGIQQNLFAMAAQTGRFNVWRGRAFEYLCLDHAARMSELLGFSGIDFTHGPFFRSPGSRSGGVQIDLLFSRADNVMTLCEMKCSVATVGKRVVREVEARAAVLQEIFPSKSIQRVLVIHGEPSRELRASGYFYRIIRATELFG